MFNSLKNDLYRVFNNKFFIAFILVVLVIVGWLCYENIPVNGVSGINIEKTVFEETPNETRYLAQYTPLSSTPNSIAVNKNTTTNGAYEEILNGVLYCIVPVCGITSILFAVFFDITTCVKGTTGNRISTGISRLNLFLCKLIFNGILYCIFTAISLITIGIFMFVVKANLIVGEYLIKEYIISFVLIGLLVSFFSTFIIAIKNWQGFIVAIILALTILVSSYLVYNVEFTSLYQAKELYTLDSEGNEEHKPNPNYLEGTKREVYTVMLHTNLIWALNCDREDYSIKNKPQIEYNEYMVRYPVQMLKYQATGVATWVIITAGISLILYRKMERA